MSWYDDMWWQWIHFWKFNLPLHEKSHKWLINLVCWYWVSYEYMWPCTSRNIDLLAQTSYIFCVSFFCVQVNPSNYVRKGTLLKSTNIDLAYVISCQDNFSSWHNNIRYIVGALGSCISLISPLPPLPPLPLPPSVGIQVYHVGCQQAMLALVPLHLWTPPSTT